MQRHPVTNNLKMLGVFALDILMGRAAILPTVDKRLPFIIFADVPPINIHGTRGRFLGNMEQPHVDFIHLAPTLAVVAVRTGSHHVCPNMLAAQMARHNVVNS